MLIHENLASIEDVMQVARRYWRICLSRSGWRLLNIRSLRASALVYIPWMGRMMSPCSNKPILPCTVPSEPATILSFINYRNISLRLEGVPSKSVIRFRDEIHILGELPGCYTNFALVVFGTLLLKGTSMKEKIPSPILGTVKHRWALFVNWLSVDIILGSIGRFVRGE